MAWENFIAALPAPWGHQSAGIFWAFKQGDGALSRDPNFILIWYNKFIIICNTYTHREFMINYNQSIQNENMPTLSKLFHFQTLHEKWMLNSPLADRYCMRMWSHVIACDRMCALRRSTKASWRFWSEQRGQDTRPGALLTIYGIGSHHWGRLCSWQNL